MADEQRDWPDKRPRELGRVGTVGSFVAAFGLLMLLCYFVGVAWLTSLLVDGMNYFWRFTGSFGWMLMLPCGIAVVVGAGMMLGDWRRRESKEPVVQVKLKSAASYDTTRPQLEYNVEA